MIENTNTKQFYPGPILNNNLEITDFLFNDAEQIKIKHSKLNEEGILVDIDLNYPTDYEVTKVLPSDINAAEAALTASTGQIMLKNVNVLAGEKLTVYRVSQIIQDKDYPRAGAFPAATHEGALDYLTMQNQEQKDEIDRALKVPISTQNFEGSLPLPVPARALKINNDGTGFEMSEFDPDLALVTTEEFKNQSQQAAAEALASQNVATEQAAIATQQATIATDKTNEVKTNHEQAITEITDLKNNTTNEITDLADNCIQELQDLSDEIKDNAEDIINRVGISMFDTILKDYVLTYEESKGLALQGTYVYKEALAGSRYGYPDFYAKCLEEYNEATNTETINGVTVKVHSNGHKFYDIANKDAIDNFFNTMGLAWFYGVDTENERIFLPRNNWFEQATGDISQVGNGVEAGLPNITGFTGFNIGGTANVTSGAFGIGLYQHSIVGYNERTDTNAIDFNASRSSAVYGNSNTVQPNAVKKLLYICVGNTTNYEGITDVVNQGMEILEQVAQKVNVDGTNLNAEGKSLISGLGFPSNKYIDLALGASGTTYIAPANGYFYCQATNVADRQFIRMLNVTYEKEISEATVTNTMAGIGCGCVLLMKKGEVMRLDYVINACWLIFVYTEGDK